jgi:hypothetical protein
MLGACGPHSSDALGTGILGGSEARGSASDGGTVRPIEDLDAGSRAGSASVAARKDAANDASTVNSLASGATSSPDSGGFDESDEFPLAREAYPEDLQSGCSGFLLAIAEGADPGYAAADLLRVNG